MHICIMYKHTHTSVCLFVCVCVSLTGEGDSFRDEDIVHGGGGALLTL